MRCLKSVISTTLLLLLLFNPTYAFTVKISGDGGKVGDQASSKDCRASSEEAFTGSAGLTAYTNEHVYSGNRALKMTIKEGSTGFGSFGGIIKFNRCEHVGGRSLKKGDEIWVRTRIYVPSGFMFNQGRNKFMRLRTYNKANGKIFSEGYDDLYINGHPEQENFRPFWFIFEGEARWYTAGTIDDYFEFGKWKTVELYLKLDNKKESEGGDARVRIWVDGNLIGDTGERRTLKTKSSFVPYFYMFTWYGNKGAPKTQSLYMDDFFLTTDTPTATDKDGNNFIGMGDPETSAPPKPPISININ